MTAIDHRTFGPAATARETLPVRVAIAVRSFLRALENRNAARRLTDLSDRELADIGLTRDDLRRAFDLSAPLDPTPHLQASARSRDLL